MYVGRSYSAGQGQGPSALGVEFNEVINVADARTQVPIQSPGGTPEHLGRGLFLALKRPSWFPHQSS